MSPAAPTNEARLVVRSGPLLESVLGRVVGMLAARARCPVDRLDDALLVTDAIAAHAGGFGLDDRVGVTVTSDEQGVTLVVGPLRAQGAAGLLRASELPGVGNVLERVADAAEAVRGASGDEQLRVRIAFEAA
jgi:hypothetical protein